MAYSQTRVIIGGLAHVPIIIFIFNLIKGKFANNAGDVKGVEFKDEEPKIKQTVLKKEKKNIIIKKIRNRKIWLLLWYKSSPPSVEYIEKLLIIPNVIIQNNKTKSNDLNF